MSLSLPPSTTPEQAPYCEPAQISKDDGTGVQIFHVPERSYYVDQNALPPTQPPAVPPRQPAPIALVIPAYKEGDDEPLPDVTKERVITTLKPVLKIQAPAQAIRHNMNGRYSRVIRAHLLPNRLQP